MYICGYFLMCGFICHEFTVRVRTLRKFPLQFMSIYSNQNIRKIMKLSPHEFPHLVQNRENICTQKLWHIQYFRSSETIRKPSGEARSA